MQLSVALESAEPAAGLPPDRGLAEKSRLLARARAIADRLLAAARTTPSGGLTWLGPHGYGTELNPLEVTQLKADLYDGVGGIALFFAAVARAGHDPEAAAICRRILLPVRKWLKNKAAGGTGGTSIPRVGGLIGAGSLLYTLLRCGDLIGDDELRGEAAALVALFTPERIAADVHGRVQTGASGAILALYALPPEWRSDAVLAASRACAERLLALQVAFAGRPPAWPISPGKPPLVGFAYGAAGVAHALGRLAAELGEPRYAAAAARGEAFVAEHYSAELDDFLDARTLFQRDFAPRRGTWRDWWASGALDDLEPAAPSGAPLSPELLLSPIWCHGSPGIAAGRLAGLAWQDGPEVRRDIAVGLRQAATAPSFGATGVADLCCGEGGRIEVLLYAARVLGDAALRETALAKLAALIASADGVSDDGAAGFTVSAARGRAILAPSLFQGLAGVGYLLLRAAEPTLPCVLVLE